MTVAVSNQSGIAIDENRVRQTVADYLAARNRHDIIDLSVAFVPPDAAQAFNRRFRRKDYIPDVLTFPPPLREIVICPQQARKNGHTIECLIHHGIDHLLGKHH